MSALFSRSGEADRAGLPWGLIALTATILTLRLVAAAFCPLTEDESYYRLWAAAPAWGYFDHPPMIAWWIAGGKAIAGDSRLGVRLLPALASAVTGLLVWDSARAAGLGEPNARRAAVWWNATLLVATGGFLATPDSPASLFWATSLWSVLRARRARGALIWWAAGGVAAGLACLSKYSGLFLAPGMLLWLAADRRGGASLRASGPWVASVLAVIIFAPNVAWNAGHHWVTFEKQFGRIVVHRLAPGYLAEFLCVQALLLNPLITVFLIRVAMLRDRLALLLPFVLTSAPFAAYLCIHALHDRVEGHWPAPLYGALAIGAAAGVRGAAAAWRWLGRAAPFLGFAAAAIALTFASLPDDPLPWGRDPALILRGWRPFAAAIERQVQEVGAAWVGTLSYGLTGELLQTRELSAPVLEIIDRQRYAGPGSAPAPNLARPGFVIDLPRRIDPRLLRACFAVAKPMGVIRRPDGEDRGQTYAIWLVDRPRPGLLARGCARP